MSFINTCLIKVFVTPAGDEGYRTSEPELIHSFIIFFVSIIVLLLLGCCGKFGMIVMYHVIVEGLTSKLWSEKGERLTDNKFHNCLVTLYHGVSKIDLFIFSMKMCIWLSIMICLALCFATFKYWNFKKTYADNINPRGSSPPQTKHAKRSN